MLWTACTRTGHTTIDGSDVVLHLPIERLDHQLFHADTAQFPSALSKAHAATGSFFRLYVEHILQGPPLEDPLMPVMLRAFVDDPDWRSVQHAADSVLGDLVQEQRAFEEAFARLKVVFPDSITPRLIAFNSGFNYGLFPTDSVLGFGVEWFVGSTHPVVARLAPEAFPQFVKQRMVPAMLVPSAVKGWLLVHYAQPAGGMDLLSNLVETGKVMALLDALLPDVDAYVKLAFTPEQLAWCEANEALIWRELAGRELLFSKKADDIGRIMNDGPFTNGFPRESPGHIGEWIGYRMVSQYLEAHPRTTFAELFSIRDPNTILKSYRPR
ncbi:MAG: hypothetical protein R2817_12895 [Flavobacteriales bacterium]